MKCLGLMILRANTTFFNNMTFFLVIRTIFFRTIGNNMPIFFAVETMQIFRSHR